MLTGNVTAIKDATQLNVKDEGLNNIISNLNANKTLVLCRISENLPIESIEEAYLKLHLISYKYFAPNSLNLENLFESLVNLAWTNQGPIELDEIDGKILASQKNNQPLEIKSIDKFPRLTDYIVPPGVRIGDASRVRLGAYLSEGTTVMHEGFVNFNAGTLGSAMIEGRISAGVVVGENSDLGGGCSTMGTLSGGNDVKISIGENCLLGANSGLGIPLGNNCIIEAGLYITGGSKITLYNSENEPGSVVKASKLAGKDNLLFIRNSQSGAIEAKINPKSVTLNQTLHKN
ncbi:MAG: 2,3,4,5-tetrahydropyridine-2,6-carboxylate N-succinyltransferase [Gammaproteobacteria bacterium TMED236]|nr:MAG: 2,3,4,5-tetrahydropyridine-2,6-carboxylate N-succinyltransferase [Gammaproteobacteria bacterium TMED236]